MHDEALGHDVNGSQNVERRGGSAHNHSASPTNKVDGHLDTSDCAGGLDHDVETPNTR
jgi:hypothetical protein